MAARSIEECRAYTHRLHSSSFFVGLYLGFLEGKPKKELPWSLWVGFRGLRFPVDPTRTLLASSNRG